MVDETSPVLEAAKRPDYRVTFERLSDSIDALCQDVVVLLKLLLNVFVDLFVDSLADYWERGVFSRNYSNHSGSIFQEKTHRATDGTDFSKRYKRRYKSFSTNLFRDSSVEIKI